MKWTVRIAAAMLMTAAFAWLLALLPQIEQRDGMDAASLLREPGGAERLGESNLVDFMAAIPLKLDILKVDWSHSVLSVDLLAAPYTTTQDTIYHDLHLLAARALQGTANVDRLLVRVLDGKGGAKEAAGLVVAMDAGRRRDSGDEPLPALADGASVRQYLQSRYNITYTQKWHTTIVR